MEEHQGQPTGVWMDLDGCFARRLVLFGVEVDLDGASIERHTPHKGEGGGEETHLLTTHAIIPLLVPECSDPSSLCTDPFRLLQRLTNSPCSNLSVLVVPAILASTAVSIAGRMRPT